LINSGHIIHMAPPPLFNDSSLAFVTIARIYAKLNISPFARKHLVRFSKYCTLLLLLLAFSLPTYAESAKTEELNGADDKESQAESVILGINTADVREDTSSVQFLNLFRTAIPFSETVPWGSSKQVEYDQYGWPSKLNGGQAGTKFLNRLPEGTVEDGFFTVLYDGEGSIFYGNDARLVVHRPNKDIIEIKSGKDKILNASLFIKKSNPNNYLRNIRILPEGGICKGTPHIRVKSAEDCGSVEYLSFEDNHFNIWATQKQIDDRKEYINKQKEQALEKQAELEKKQNIEKNSIAEKEVKPVIKVVSEDSEEGSQQNAKQGKSKQKRKSKKSKKAKRKAKKNISKKTNETFSEINGEVKGQLDIGKAIIFNPDYLEFMKDFQLMRFMNMSGMTRNPVKKWKDRNSLKKATWGGKYGSRGAPVEIMVALSNQVKAHAWFSMPYKASNHYIEQFAKYVNTHLDPDLKAYIEYSNEVWNPIFIHHDYAIAQGKKAGLDKRKSPAGYKWYSRRSVETFKIWEKTFGGLDRLVRVMGSWSSNQKMSSTILSYKDAYKHTDAIAIGPYVSAHPKVLRRAKTVDDVFKAMMDKRSKWGMKSTINYIKKQVKVAKSFGVDLIAYEGGQHLVDWNTREAEQHPNPLLYAANRDPRMGTIYDELMREWNRAGGKLFVAFSAPRIYSWYGSWGIKEHIRQPRSQAPKYDALLRYLDKRKNPQQAVQQQDVEKEKSKDALASLAGELKEIAVTYANKPHLIWDMSQQQQIESDLEENNPNDISAYWQANWDSKNLYFSFAIYDDDLQKEDKVTLTLDTTSELEERKIQLEKEKEADKIVDAQQQKIKEAKEKRRLKRIQEQKQKEKEKEEGKKEDKKEQGSKESEKTKDKTKDTQEKADNDNDKKVEKTINSKNVEKDSSNNSVSAIQKEIEKELNKALKKSAGKSADSKEKEIEKIKKEKETKTAKNDAQANKKSQAKNDAQAKGEVSKDDKELVQENDEKDNKNIKRYTFSLFESPLEKTYMIPTDAGYLLNIAIPWSELYSAKEKHKILAKTGDKIGISIEVSDTDKGETNTKLLSSTDGSSPFPKLVLENAPIQ